MTNAEFKSKLETSLAHLQSELSQIRTGRVNPTLLDGVKVAAYGSFMTLREVGTITVIDAQTMQVAPWDKGLSEAIASAVRSSDLKLNPVVKGDTVLVPVPPLTEERRLEFAKLVSAKLEECKSALRNIRQDAMKAIDVSFANKEFGEDEKFTKKEQIENTVKEYSKKAEESAESKKQELLGR